MDHIFHTLTEVIMYDLIMDGEYIYIYYIHKMDNKIIWKGSKKNNNSMDGQQIHQ